MANRRSRRFADPANQAHHAMDRDGLADRLRLLLLAALTSLYVAAPLNPSESVARAGTGLPLVMMWLLLALVWLVVGWLQGALEGRLGWTGLAVLLLVALHTLSGLVMAWHGSPRPAINMIWQWLGFGIGFLMVCQLVRTGAECRAICAVMIVLAVCLSMFGFYQYFVSMPRDELMYGQDPERMLREAGVNAPAGSPLRSQFEARLRDRQPTATFALTNSLASYLTPWLVMALGIAATTEKSGRSAYRRWMAVGCCAMPITGCLLLTKSRAAVCALLAVILAMALVWLFRRREAVSRRWKTVLPGVALLAGLIVGAAAFGRLNADVLGEAAKSLSFRFQYWQASMKLIADYPWLGCGPGNFQYYYTAYKLPEASEEVADPHNFLLEVWSTAGTPTMLAMLTVLCCFVGQLLLRGTATPAKMDVPSEGPVSSAVAAIYAGAIVGVGLAHADVYPFAWRVGYPAVFEAPWLGFRLPVMWATLPVAAVCLALLHGWVRRGRLPHWLPPVGAAVLLINLSAAGGIGFPGVAGTLWLLMGLALNVSETGRPPSIVSSRIAAVMVVCIALAAAACHHTALGPVLNAQAPLRAGSSARNAATAKDRYETAARLDPFSAEPWENLAAIYHRQWFVAEPNRTADELFTQFEESSARFLELSRHSSRARKRVGDWYLTAYRKSDERRHIDEAVRQYTRATRLYRNSNILHSQLAWAYYLSGNREEAAREAAVALSLDEVNPHKEQKLKWQELVDSRPATEGHSARAWMLRLRGASGENERL